MSFSASQTSVAIVGLATATVPALAADMPVAPEPIDYVRVCDSYGSRFYYIPGTETCLRVGGRVRAEYRANNFGDAPSDWSNRTRNDIGTRARGYLYLDSRTNTEFGLLRTYTSIYGTNTSGAEAFALEYGYIQFGGFTFGKAQSNWDFWTGYAFGARIDDYSDVDLPLAAYTAAFGDGFSATLSIEDGNFRRTNLISPVTGGYAGMKIPDLVANLHVERDWGSAQLMGALHQIRFSDATSDGTLGWAVGGGVEVNVPVLGRKDTFALQIAYSDGASGFPLDSWDSRITDAVNTGGSTKTTKTWNIAGGWNHAFTDAIESNVEGGYHSVDAGSNAYDFNQWGVTGNVVWSPVKGLAIGGEIQYRSVDFNSASGLSDTDDIFATFRVQRTF